MSPETLDSPVLDDAEKNNRLPVLDDLSFFVVAGRTANPAAALDEGEQADRMGLVAAWLSERYDLKEAGALLGGVAARTQRLQIGTSALAAGSRHPLLTAGLACTMQAMYGGRFILGLGRSAAEYLRGQSMRAFDFTAFEDYVGIVRRLMSGETVTYDGPAGSYEALKVVDLPAAGAAPIWSGIMGGPRACRLAARIADGVMLSNYLTPEAVHECVKIIRTEREKLDLDPAAIRICASVTTACDLDDVETMAIAHARLVTYVQMRTFSAFYSQLNGWSEKTMTAIQEHPQFNDLPRANADQVFHRKDLLGPSELVPQEWIDSSCAVGSPSACVQKLEQFKAAGADELALYGTTPSQNASLIEAWRARSI
jgi:5,10-methylenetetrahydromethanopterin reductase